MISLRAGATALDTLEAIYREGAPPALDASARPRVEAAAALVCRAAAGETAVYGVNTGFGKLASCRIHAEDTRALQRKLILSHCCGVGAALPRAETRLIIALKLLSLGRGASGVRWAVIDTLHALLEREVTPRVPSQGSVGASGDLAPLAHMAAVLIGEGEAFYRGERLPGREALRRAGIAPLALGPKEGLALINGTQFSNANALAALFNARRLAQSALLVSALSTDAVMGSTAPLNAEIHRLRGHRGQIDVADRMASMLRGSEIRESHRDGDSRVQDPYCIRCQPQVLGAALDVLRMAAATLAVEANAVTDNPLVLVEGGEIASGGNFHAEPVGFAADMIALAIAEIGAIAQRRVALMVDPALSFDLPPFLSPDPGLNSGFMVAEVTSAALMSENKHLANPCVIDSTPTSANQEDHVAMAAHGALRLGRMNDNLAHIVAIELLCAAQGIEARAPRRTSAPLRRVLARLRRDVAPLAEDRPLAPDIARACALVRSRELCDLADAELSL